MDWNVENFNRLEQYSANCKLTFDDTAFQYSTYCGSFQLTIFLQYTLHEP